MASFLEEHVRPRAAALRVEFQHEYLRVYSAWSQDGMHRSASYDTDKCWRMVEIAESSLAEIAARYYRRILIKAPRTLPLSAMAAICVEPDELMLVEKSRDATVAAWLFGRRAPPEASATGDDGANSLYSSEEEVSRLKSELGPDLSRLMGAVFARQTAEQSHRMAGKGGRLERPAPYTLVGWREFKKGYPPRGILLMPRPEFEEDKTLVRSVKLYESRRSAGAATTGMLTSDKRAPPGPASFGWWPPSSSGSRAVRPRRDVIARRVVSPPGPSPAPGTRRRAWCGNLPRGNCPRPAGRPRKRPRRAGQR